MDAKDLGAAGRAGPGVEPEPRRCLVRVVFGFRRADAETAAAPVEDFHFDQTGSLPEKPMGEASSVLVVLAADELEGGRFAPGFVKVEGIRLHGVLQPS